MAIATITGLLASLNERKLQKIEGSRASLCARLGAPALPAQRWQWVIFKTVKVHIDYHAKVDFHRYSGPHSRVGLALQVRITDARSRASRCECTSLQTQGCIRRTYRIHRRRGRAAVSSSSGPTHAITHNFPP
ncbi:hypothetical protein D5047_05615 [Verminephrobacter eiseniae]|nr:hypothetical protein [Verminephrobacter eiseniae]